MSDNVAVTPRSEDGVVEGTQTRPVLRGLELRYALTISILDHQRELTIEQLAALVDDMGFDLTGRSSKVISDALRWEIRRGRIVRVCRGQYGLGRLPRSTEWWMRRRLESLDC